MRSFALSVWVVLAVMFAASTAFGSAIPSGRTSVAKLAPPGFEHRQVLRIAQDFHPNEAYEIALDAWISSSRPDAIAEVRMWWLDTGSDGERSPFGRGVRKHIDIDYHRQSDDRFIVQITQGRKRYAFEVELQGKGDIEAYADVEADGTVVDHCRVRNSRLVARKLLGLPVGLKHLAVTCTDAEGKTHRGKVVRQ